MTKVLRYLILFFALALSSHGYSQTVLKEFSPDSIEFFEEMKTMLMEKQKKEGKDFMEEFELYWYGGKLSEYERNAIYRTCNFMLEKRLLPFPDFRSYLFSLMSFQKSGQSKESFDAWQISLERLINGRSKKNFAQYLAFSSHLFEENAIYKSGTTVWKSSSSKYRFKYTTEPLVIFEALDLKCFAKKDSAIIHNTEGIYYPNSKKWEGTGGTVDWVRAGFKPTEVFATLRNYHIAMKSSDYKADSVTFTNTNFFDAPMEGNLEDKVLANVVEEKASYPRFNSFNKRLVIENIVPNVDYDGGFAQHGAKFIGSGSNDQKATLIFKREGQPFLRAAALSYIIRPDKISSGSANVVIYLDQDSISHPSVKLNFQTEKRLLTLVRDDNGVSKSPYFNSWQQIDMYFEALYWKIDDPFMEFKSLEGVAESKAEFESARFYKEHRYDRLQGMDRIHPLIRIKNCTRQLGYDEMYAEEAARCMGMPITQVQPMLMRLGIMGYLDYDFETHYVKIKDKLYHYIEAKAEKTDYDVVQFNSETTEESNATMNLHNFDMTIRGVKRIFLSDSQKVYIYPDRRTIVLKKNRDFDFGGIINAGQFEFYGKNFGFDYDAFDITMPKIDSLRIWAHAEKKDEKGRALLRRVTTVIENLDGKLEIDEPGNLSGVKDRPIYPIFSSYKNSYVYYDRHEISNKVYDREKFFFELDPYVIDSLNSFDNNAIDFAGTFESEGIFPTFRERLILMPDYSMGFVHPTPEEGFPMYGGKGDFNAAISMSHEGLTGDGTLKYLTSTTNSTKMKFFPDSMNCIAERYNIEEQMGKVQFPPVNGTNVKIHWRPYHDVMRVWTMEEPMTFYDGTSKLTGGVRLRPDGLTGRGLFQFDGAELEAKLFKFEFSEFGSDTADFRLQSLTESTIAFSTENVSAHIDFTERKGDFHSNGGGAFINFPVNEYICYMEKFTWFMDKEEIELGADKVVQAEGQEDVTLEGAQFISVHAEQDSLSFYSPAAIYDLRASIIRAKRVVFVPCADALIYPDSGNVVIRKKADMEEFVHSEIVANSISKYHKIYDANIDVQSKKKYTGSGSYDYVDEEEKIQTIYFRTIQVDSTMQTVAEGSVEEDVDFTLSPHFKFYGDVHLQGNNRLLNFEGTSQIGHACENIPISWFSFKADIDPEEIFIPIDTLLIDDKKNKLSVGLNLRADSASLYSSFVSTIEKKEDERIIPTTGFMVYEKDRNEYRVSNIPKLTEIALPGNYFSLDVENCVTYGEGTMNFGVDLGYLKLSPVGNITHYLQKDSVVLNTMILLDFLFDENAMEEIFKYIRDVEGLDLKPANFERPVYERGMAEYLGKEAADKAISQVNLYGRMKQFPDELMKPMFLSDVKMRWDKQSQSYKSVGDICLGNVYKKQINKYVEGKMEIIKKRSGDVMHLYLEIDQNTWFYFYYNRNVLQAVSSVDKFNNIIKELKADKRKFKYAKGQTYSFMIGSSKKKSDFIRSFEGIGAE